MTCADFPTPASSPEAGVVRFALESCTSTQDALRQRLNQNPSATLLVLQTREQTAGRGRDGRTWVSSAPGSLTLSLALTLPRPLPEGFPLSWLPLACGEAVCQALKSCHPDLEPHLKWPNDLMLTRGKVGGLLLENPQFPPWRILVGLGLNLLPPDPERLPAGSRPTSLAQEGGTHPDPERLQAELIKAFLQVVPRLLERRPADWPRALLPLLQPAPGSPIRFHPAGRAEHIEGIFTGLSPDGGLLLLQEGEESPVCHYAGDLLDSSL